MVFQGCRAIIGEGFGRGIAAREVQTTGANLDLGNETASRCSEDATIAGCVASTMVPLIFGSAGKPHVAPPIIALDPVYVVDFHVRGGPYTGFQEPCESMGEPRRMVDPDHNVAVGFQGACLIAGRNSARVAPASRQPKEITSVAIIPQQLAEKVDWHRLWHSVAGSETSLLAHAASVAGTAPGAQCTTSGDT